MTSSMDDVFKALADPSRRQLLDSLNVENGQTLRDLCAGLDMARQSVSKHLAILEAADLVVTVRQGREKLHYLNAGPINDISDRWITRYDRARTDALSDLKRALEATPMTKPAFVYRTYIDTTPEQLWRALTEREFTERYWGMTPITDLGDRRPHDVGRTTASPSPTPSRSSASTTPTAASPTPGTRSRPSWATRSGSTTTSSPSWPPSVGRR